MPKYIIAFISLLILTTVDLRAADVELQWDPVSGATTYAVESSVDQGVTWGGRQDAGGEDTVHIYTGTPEDGLVLFRVMAQNSQQEAIRTHSGAWYNHLLLPIDSPGGAGIQ